MTTEDEREGLHKVWADARELRRAKFKRLLTEDAGLIVIVAGRLAMTNRVIRSLPSQGEILDHVPEAISLIKIIQRYKAAKKKRKK